MSDKMKPSGLKHECKGTQDKVEMEHSYWC